MIDLERLGYELYKDSDATCFGPDHPAYELYKSAWTRKARRLIETALGDEPLYRSTVPEMVEPYVHSDTSLIQHLVDAGSLVRVWPLGVNGGEGG